MPNRLCLNSSILLFREAGKSFHPPVKIFRRVFVVLIALFVIYTLYCTFSVPLLCDLKTKNPKTTAFQEQRKEQWEKAGIHKKIDQRWVPVSAISRHLRVLENARLIQRRRIGRLHMIRTRTGGLKQIHQWIARYAAGWDSSFDTLDKLLREEQEKERRSGSSRS